VHVIEIVLIFSDTIKFHKTDGCLFSLAVLVVHLVYPVTGVTPSNIPAERSFMKTFDSEGVFLRKAHRLKRRKYRAKGPNFVWHVDGYDKLKPYGFCIHGSIDGYSRRLLWLEVSQSNNNPRVIAMYYLEAIRRLGVAPRLLR